MTLRELRLHQFRSHHDISFKFDDQVTAITGSNGSGKTTILEAVYTVLSGRSFRDADEDLIEYTQDWWRIEAEIDERTRELRYQPSNKGKQLIIDGSTKGRFTYRQQLPVVLFEPDQLFLIQGSPGERRKYLDIILLQISPAYRDHLARYERALTQRNNVLKRPQAGGLDDALFVWDIALSEHGAAISEARNNLVQELNSQLSGLYSSLAGNEQTLHISYLTSLQHEHDTRSQLLANLRKNHERDAMRGFTSVGPHRDDIVFSLNDKNAQQSASRGETRSIILSLKFAERQLLADHTGLAPIMLFDDVLSELDDTRRKFLARSHRDSQIIYTTTERVPKSVYTIKL
jgi:DNA replication and repair protein RecF